MLLAPDAPFVIPNHNGRAWWNLPERVRSFEATEYIGVEKSFRLIEDDIFPVDVILGYSQGAILGSVLLARSALGLNQGCATKLILFGAAWPNPYSKIIKSFSVQDSSSGIPNNEASTLHVIGEKDAINPPESALLLQHYVGGSYIMHPGGHIVPVDEEYIDKYVRFVL